MLETSLLHCHELGIVDQLLDSTFQKFLQLFHLHYLLLKLGMRKQVPVFERGVCENFHCITLTHVMEMHTQKYTLEFISDEKTTYSSRKIRTRNPSSRAILSSCLD